MIQYIIRRVLLFIPKLIVITFIAFGIIHMAPGDPAELKAGVGGEGAMRGNQQLNEDNIKQIRAQWHLDKPVWFWTILTDEKDSTGRLLPMSERWTFKLNGFDNQYSLWLKDIIHGDFGKSFQDNREVMDKIWERIPITFLLSIISIILSYIIAIPLGIYSATHQDNTLDKISTVVVFILYSLPSFWIATMAIIFFGGGDFFAWFPNNGLHSMNISPDDPWMTRTLDYIWHLILPVAMYTYGSFAFLSRQMRGSMLEVIRQDYIRTARAKGLSNKAVVYKHALRNSLIPIVTIIAYILPGLIGGSVIIETIFSIPGVGQLGFQALIARDFPLILAEFVLVSVLTLFGLLLADILYTIVDPRIAFTRKTA